MDYFINLFKMETADLAQPLHIPPWWQRKFVVSWGRMFSSLVPRLSSKMGGGESLVTSVGKGVNFQCLALAVPIRLQTEATCTRDTLSIQQNIVNSKINL